MCWQPVRSGGICHLIIRNGKAGITIFASLRTTGRGTAVHERLRAAVREKSGRDKHPTAGCLDWQSVKTVGVSSCFGYDAGKKVKGRKRHILVDTLGLLLVVMVTVADTQDREGAKLLLGKLSGSCKKLRRIWVDGGYRGELLDWVKSNFKFVLAVVLRPEEQKGFYVLPCRSVVERTFAWLNDHRRLSKDCEVFPKTSETFILIAMTRLMLRKLQPLCLFKQSLSYYLLKRQAFHAAKFKRDSCADNR